MNKYIKIMVSVFFVSFVGIVACENAIADTEEKVLTIEDKSRAFVEDLSQSATSEISYDKIALEDTEIVNKAEQYLTKVGFSATELDKILFDKSNNRSLKDVGAAVTWLALMVAVSEIPELVGSTRVGKTKATTGAYTSDFGVYNCLFQAVGMQVGFQIIERSGLSSTAGKAYLIESFSESIANDLGPLSSVFATIQFSACVNSSIVDTIN